MLIMTGKLQNVKLSKLGNFTTPCLKVINHFEKGWTRFKLSELKNINNSGFPRSLSLGCILSGWSSQPTFLLCSSWTILCPPGPILRPSWTILCPPCPILWATCTLLYPPCTLLCREETAPPAVLLRVRRRRRLQQDELQEDGDPGRQGCCYWLVHDRAARRSNPDNQLHGRPRQRVCRRGLILGGAGLPTRAQGGLRAPSTPSLYTPQRNWALTIWKRLKFPYLHQKPPIIFLLITLFNCLIW